MFTHNRVCQKGKTLSAENRHRLENVLRLRVGDKFLLTDGESNEALVTLEKNGNFTTPDWKQPQRETTVATSLYAAVSKGERFEWLIEKAVELGVRQIFPLLTENCIAKAPSEAKLERWQKIAVSAMIQCGGCIEPKIMRPLKIYDIPHFDDNSLAILLHEQPLSVSLQNFPTINTEKLLLASGPEGGFSQSEVEFFINRGWQTLWLGRRIFKSDTAPIIALANMLVSDLARVNF